ncbi:MAG TPA: tRNA (adenosine(37)-N6)-threonylcarbamoyltransferase complex dimerization subunit type 1 TsaB [Planctomycetaceae bacterium]|nr:tRNA (adenosine(37)-N6)-threonylcarbamoyltransferase complex dimerization subunit type 1 TsaB [Planctomycetaceae bacterium]
MLTLAIETSGPVGSLALFDRDARLGEQTLELGRQHGQSLIPAIRRMFRDSGKTLDDCGLVAVSVGPGSFTGLRVGVVCAKTLSYAIGCHLAAVDTLQAIACNSPSDTLAVEVVCDAHRGELFVGKYARRAAGEWAPVDSISVVPSGDWVGGLQSSDTVTGPALGTLAGLVAGRCRVLPAEFRVPHATYIARLGIQALESGLEADFWAVEPLYLRRSSAESQWEKLHGVAPS